MEGEGKGEKGKRETNHRSTLPLKNKKNPAKYQKKGGEE